MNIINFLQVEFGLQDIMIKGWPLRYLEYSTFPDSYPPNYIHPINIINMTIDVIVWIIFAFGIAILGLPKKGNKKSIIEPTESNRTSND